MTFAQLFARATCLQQPYGWQCRLAGGEAADPQGLFSHGTVCQSRLIQIPTGLGKTAGVVLAWLWNRVCPQPSVIGDSPAPTSRWPRRLVYCLPMRTLVEQTADNVRAWLANLWQHRAELGLSAAALEELLWLASEGTPEHPAHSPVILMGGEELEDACRDWDVYPEKPAILIGTQDMLLSRALNRGYGMSRYRWPMHFGLLNNDCLWVHDETQLMGVGLETSVQMAGFRERFGNLAPCAHWWMSATLAEARLITPEAPARPPQLQLSVPEQSVLEVQRRLTAVKRLRQADASLDGDHAAYAKSLAGEVVSSHISGTLTLVIVNSVERAQAVFREVRKQSPKQPATLLHSRFRPAERRALVRRVLESAGDHIVVSTQVVEAGVDLSARTLFTELAPWSSLVQRFGRCHRHGEMTDTGADIRWVNLPDAEAAPYATEDLAAARKLLAGLTDASPAALASVTAPPAPEAPRHVIRPKDLRELFDTTPDIAGADLDVSRFIRESEDSDCLVFWRGAAPEADSPGPSREELCPVPVGQLREFVEKQKDKAVWVWDALDRQWTHPERFVPGRTYWLLSSLGGYDPGLGFDRRSKAEVVPVTQPVPPPEAHDEEPGTNLPRIETLEEHTAAVVSHSVQLAADFGLPRELCEALTLAAQWHDVGKAHPVFQAALRRANPALQDSVLYAKSGSQARLVFEGRPHFRHELASALAFRALAARTTPQASLVAYLIAAHHGKVRLSLRSLPGESEPPRPPDGGDPLYARGIWHGDTLPALTLNGAAWPAVTLSLAPMQIGLGPDGEPSWLESCLALRDAPTLGPFRLALLEALLRAADMRASAVAADAYGKPRS